MTHTIGPGSTIGILGAGQLGRMLALVARRMGYGVAVFGGDRRSPCGQVADAVWAGNYDDTQQLTEFASACDVVTYEFENIPAHAAATIADLTPLHPNADLLAVAQNRLKEKTALRDCGLPTAEFRMVHTADELALARSDFGGDVILKANTDGYDGKGQWSISAATNLEELWTSSGLTEGLVEQRVPFEFELSVVAGRYASGECVYFEPFLNHHADHILDVTISGSNLVSPVAEQATQMARGVLERFHVVGVLCIELFLTSDGQLVVNEIAPRPHNSGHLTIEAYNCSQFELQLRTICGLEPVPLIRTAPAAAMANLLGQHLPATWDAAAMSGLTDTQLHLYGKSGAKTGRKMGHVTTLANTSADAEDRVRSVRSQLTAVR
ncbi:MAG: 5-(carboxyamino)imidazole ribonucleotide synthase [Planctomycetaceae bacterium]|nr:5-(carboxyamino)imidazole ribonucleotide synthase [Planctomycetaceae bacterium]